MPSIVQQVTGAPAAATGFTTSAITTDVENVLLLIVGRSGGAGTGALTGVTDTAGNTWTVATRGGVSGGSNTRCEVWKTTQNVNALTAGTVSVTSATSQGSTYNLVEVSGLNKTSLVDVTSPDLSGAAAATTHSTPAVATTYASDWVLSVINHPHNAAADTFTSSGGVQLTSVVNSTAFRTSAGYYPTTATGSYDGDWTLPASLAAGLITVAFQQAVAVNPEPFTVLVDWNRDGDYGDTGDNVTSLVRRAAAPVSVEYGRDQSTALAPTVSGRGSFTLDNVDKRFSPRNTSSPLFGNIKPARPVKITRTLVAAEDPYADEYTDFYGVSETTEKVLFIGHTDDSPINPDVDAKTVSLSLVDSLADFRGQTISTALYGGLRTGEAIDIILDECGWTGSRDLDTGATVIPWWWEDGTDALDALEKLVRCEGPPALLTIGVDGGIVFKDRHHRLVDTGSITSQDTWNSVPGLGEPIMLRPGFTYDEAWRNIINTGLTSVDVRTPAKLDAVWTLDSPLGFTASQTQTFIAATSDPFMNAVAPAVNTDYTIISGSISSITLSRTSGASTTITVTAGGGGAQISSLQLRAQLVQTVYTMQVAASDAGSIADYGSRSFPGDLPFCNQYDAQAVLDTAVELRSEPLPVINTKFMIGGFNTTRAAATLSRDLSDRVTVVEPETVLNDDFYIESIAHDFTGQHDHTITFGLEAVPPAGAVTAANVFLIGSAVSGHRIGTGKLAS